MKLILESIILSNKKQSKLRFELISCRMTIHLSSHILQSSSRRKSGPSFLFLGAVFQRHDECLMYRDLYRHHALPPVILHEVAKSRKATSFQLIQVMLDFSHLRQQEVSTPCYIIIWGVSTPCYIIIWGVSTPL